MLNKFRETFAVEKKEDIKKRPPDKNFQIRLYTKVDRDYWAYMDLREWYNKTGAEKGHGGAFIDGKPALDSASTSFIVNNPKDTDGSSLANKSNYMLKCGGPHDPSGFLKSIRVD